MLSIAKSRFTLALQAVFLTLNAVSVFCAVVYNASTPDLYPNNAHHKIGWILTWTICCHVLVSFAGRLVDMFKARNPTRNRVSQESAPLARINSWDEQHFAVSRDSNDSGHGTEPNTASLRSTSVSSLCDNDGDPSRAYKEYSEEDDGFASYRITQPSANTKFAAALSRLGSSTAWKYVKSAYCVLDRFILPFAFVAFVTGIATYGRFFVSEVTSPLLSYTRKG